jgi:hypothetical protein
MKINASLLVITQTYTAIMGAGEKRGTFDSCMCGGAFLFTYSAELTL